MHIIESTYSKKVNKWEKKKKKKKELESFSPCFAVVSKVHQAKSVIL